MVQLNTIDLFAGAGGITEGFRQAGFRCLYANDFNQSATDTFKLNHPEAMVSFGSIEGEDPSLIRKKLGLAKGELDCLVGGPPCQGFSIYAPERILEDPRNSLFLHYFRFVDEFSPQSLMIENVPGMLSLSKGAVVNTIVSELRGRGYHVNFKIMLASHYGVPQARFRMIFLASKTGGLCHPEPENFHIARTNFTGGREHTFRLGELDSRRLTKMVSLKDAISDLPPLVQGSNEERMSYGRRKVLSDFAASMKGDENILYNHICNKLAPINLERLKHIRPGGAWTDIPFELLPKGMQKARRSDHTKRYGRLSWDSVACTMLTKCDPHWGAVFHPSQERTFSVREAARIQSFPDSYRFLGNKGSQYEQVGNAVPVLMAKAIAESIKSHVVNSSQSVSRAS